MSKKALGRGLSALFPQAGSLDQDLVHLGIDQIRPAEAQPRKHFDESKLKELAQSIKANGLIQPLVVRRSGDGFQLIAGERRWRAAQLAGIHKVPCVIKDASDDSVLELSLIENLQREDLNPIEEAAAYNSLVETLGMTQDQVAQRIGKDRSTVANSLRLLRLPPEVQTLVQQEKISMGHARALLALASAERQIRLANEIVARALSVRQAEALTSKSTRDSSSASTRKPRLAGEKANILAAETKLRKRLGAPVNIRLAKEGGVIEIKFSSMDDLTRLFDQLMQKS
ncbi:MAG TPA: ParB/RepB/Spo0J family partition protein [Blastocatellia bacterium]|jgi:ParB family chromosome partitioning protein|nr:ParB/RepB/Spo0J family partition protein [Blastocatellia bacterium]